MSGEITKNDHVDPTTTIDDENPNSSPSSAAIAKGLSTLLSSVITDFDSAAESTITGQDQLASSLDRLTGELDQLLDAAPLPFIIQHATKLSTVRKRVISLNLVLKSIQRRIDNIDRVVSAGLLQEKVVARETSGQK